MLTKLRLISSITQLPNEEFMHLYLQMIVLVKKYVPITNNEYLQGAYENMQKVGERVKQLDAKLMVASKTVKMKNEVHKDIKNTIKYIKLTLESNLLSPMNDDRTNAKYCCEKLKGLLDLKRMVSMAQTATTIDKIKDVFEDDTALSKALMELGLLNSVEMLYKQGEEFRLLQQQINTDKVTTPVINKPEIRKEATETLRLLFKAIGIYNSLSKEEVWVEMADEVRELVIEATSEE